MDKHNEMLAKVNDLVKPTRYALGAPEDFCRSHICVPSIGDMICDCLIFRDKQIKKSTSIQTHVQDYKYADTRSTSTQKHGFQLHGHMEYKYKVNGVQVHKKIEYTYSITKLLL
jgi:hypothetical protein